MAQGALGERLVVPVLHTRPSRIVKIFNDQKGLAVEGVSMTASDLDGTITLVGSNSAIAEAKSRLSLFDNSPRKVCLKLLVESPFDHADWKANLEVSNNSSWSGKDERTGTAIALRPRLNDDDSVTMILDVMTDDGPAATLVFRSKLNEPYVIGFPMGKAAVIGPGAANVKGPRISVTFAGDPK